MKTLKDIRAELFHMTKRQLVFALLDIASRLYCDENGRIDPAESTAADSGADFVDSVNHTFVKLDIHIAD
jgi:hypothetical protein